VAAYTAIETNTKSLADQAAADIAGELNEAPAE
jgi:hypothetical protein